MYVGIDIGGTKTLLATLSDEGALLDSAHFSTNHDYAQFIKDLGEHFDRLVGSETIRGIGVGIPGLLQREQGTVVALGNLPWRDKPIRADISAALKGLPIVIENDSKLGALSEAQHLLGSYNDVLYITISTGIGGGLTRNGAIVAAMADSEIGKMPLLHDGKIEYWEDFAGGRAIIKRYGKLAAEINEPKSWKEIADHIAYGVAVASTVIQPDAIVFGGGVGQFFDKFGSNVAAYMDKHLHAIAKRPKLLAAKHPDKAVIYGCYLAAKELTK